MRPWTRWIYVIAVVAAVFVGVSTIVQAIREGSWAPIAAVGWLPAVIVAVAWPGSRGRCLPRRRRSAG